MINYQNYYKSNLFERGRSSVRRVGRRRAPGQVQGGWGGRYPSRAVGRGDVRLARGEVRGVVVPARVDRDRTCGGMVRVLDAAGAGHRRPREQVSAPGP